MNAPLLHADRDIFEICQIMISGSVACRDNDRFPWRIVDRDAEVDFLSAGWRDRHFSGDYVDLAAGQRRDQVGERHDLIVNLEARIFCDGVCQVDEDPRKGVRTLGMDDPGRNVLTRYLEGLRCQSRSRTNNYPECDDRRSKLFGEPTHRLSLLASSLMMLLVRDKCFTGGFFLRYGRLMILGKIWVGERRVVLAFDQYRLDIERRELRRDAELIDLEPKAFDLLAFLIQHRDRVLSKDDLLQALWQGRIVSESALTTRINAVRRAIGDDGTAQRLIRTFTRKGIRFVGEVTQIAEPAVPDKPSIAVLPFHNLSGDPEQDYFADGMVEEITTAIARCPGLFVIARNSSYAYKGKSIDVKQVARELRVRSIAPTTPLATRS